MSDVWLIYSTFAGKDEALSAARALLERRLVACANISENIISAYRWQGKIEEAREAVLIAKTRAGKVDEAAAVLARLHPYELPCIVSWPLAKGHAPFLEWVEAEAE